MPSALTPIDPATAKERAEFVKIVAQALAEQIAEGITFTPGGVAPSFD